MLFVLILILAQDGVTVITMAAKHGDRGVINALIAAGADVKVADNVRISILQFCISRCFFFDVYFTHREYLI